jgi:hypothetical protein
MDDDNILDTWPADQPDNWACTVLTRKQARDLMDAVEGNMHGGMSVALDESFDALVTDLDDAQGKAESEPAYLLIKIVPSDI